MLLTPLALPQIWDKLETHEKQQLLPKYFSSWEKDGTDRTEAIKLVLKCLTTTERNFVQSYVKPRGPYRYGYLYILENNKIKRKGSRKSICLVKRS